VHSSEDFFDWCLASPHDREKSAWYILVGLARQDELSFQPNKTRLENLHNKHRNEDMPDS
jgi:hypothetical protein